MALSALSEVVASIDLVLIDEQAYRWWDWDLVKDVYLLQQELKRMQIFFENLWGEDEDTMLLKIRDLEIIVDHVAYEAKDVIETLALETFPLVGVISNVIKTSASTCFRIDAGILQETIKKLTSQIIKKESVLYQSRISSHRAQSFLKTLISGRSNIPHFLEQNYVVGFDADIEKLVSVLVDDDKSKGYRVVSIWGKGGSGKTALAKKLYHHGRVRNHFDFFAWAYVSQTCERRDVWERILIGLDIFVNEDRTEDDQKVAEKLFKFLKEHKCLVILDNIPSIEAWHSIKPALPRSQETSSKILITGRHKIDEEALQADKKCYGYLHELQPLNFDESLELFRKIALCGRQLTDAEDQEIMFDMGKAALSRCKGLPLAIVLLGGVFATLQKDRESSFWVRFRKRRERWFWMRFMESDLGVFNILEFSYNAMLPAPLKSCFLYLSIFPAGSEISAAKLIQLWAAECIPSHFDLLQGSEMRIEDMAEYLLMELVERCIVQVGERDANLKIKTCYLSDMVREMCVAKARQANSFVDVINDASQIDFDRRNENTRALAMHVYFDLAEIIAPNLKCLFFFNVKLSDEFTLRSLSRSDEIYHTKNNKPWLSMLLLLNRVISKFNRLWRYLINNYKRLRVLEFEGTDFYLGGKLHVDIGKLTQLRYLNLQTATHLTKLPSSLGDLIKLQTLNLGIDGKFCVYVPDVLWKLERLRHLYLPNICDDKTKLKLNTLTKLQTLVNFSTKNCYAPDLYFMVDLRELKISRHFNFKDIVEQVLHLNPLQTSIRDLIRDTTIQHLRSLFISSLDPINPQHFEVLLSHCANIYELTLAAEMNDHQLPPYQRFSSTITGMYLRGSNLYNDPMPTLEKMPNLKVLELQKAFVVEAIVCSSQGFAQLDSLKLIENYKLKMWRVDKDAMPKLHHLEIVKCSSLTMLPRELGLIQTLEELKIERMPKAFKDRLVQRGEDFCNFQHISPIIFRNCN